MWTLFTPLLGSQSLADVTDVSSRQPLNRTELQAVSHAVTQFYQAQQGGAPATPATQAETAHSLDRLASSGSLSPEELQQIQAVHARVAGGLPLSQQDMREVTGVVDNLEQQLTVTHGERTLPYGDIDANPYVNGPPETATAREHYDHGRTAFNGSEGHPPNYELAEREFRQGLASLPPGNDALRGHLQFDIATAMERQGRLPEAVQGFRQVSGDASVPQATRDHAQQALGMVAREYHGAALRADQGGDPVRAEQLIRDGLAALPPGQANDEFRGRLQYSLAASLENQGRSAEARPEYERVVANPSAPSNLQERARGRITELDEHVLLPENPYATPETSTARTHAQQGRELATLRQNWPAAEREFRQALATLPPGNGELQGQMQFNVAVALENQGRRADAITEYGRVLTTPGATESSRSRAEERLHALQADALSGIVPNPYRPN